MKFKLLEAYKLNVKTTPEGCLDLSGYSKDDLLKSLANLSDCIELLHKMPVDNELAIQVFPDGTCISSTSHMDIDFYLSEIIGDGYTEDGEDFGMIQDTYPWIGYSFCYNFNALMTRFWDEYKKLSITIPRERLTNTQYEMLEEYFEDVLLKSGKETEVSVYQVITDEGTSYNLSDYLPKDIINRIKRFYTSGVFYQ